MSSAATPPTEKGYTEVAALIDAFGDAVHARDVAASMRLLADDADVSVIPSEGVDLHRGPASVQAFLELIYRGPRRYGWRWDNRWISVENGVAWFVALGHETVDEATRAHVVPYCMTGVAALTSAGWRLRLLHGSEAQQP